jgi:hypothetical protein
MEIIEARRGATAAQRLRLICVGERTKPKGVTQGRKSLSELTVL